MRSPFPRRTNQFQWTDAMIIEELLCWCALHSRAESVTENWNRYRDILKKPKPTPTSVLKKREKNRNRRKKYRKNENSVFADDNLLISSMHFLPLTLRNEDVKLHYPPVLSLLLCTVLENCLNSSSTSRNNTGGPPLTGCPKNWRRILTNPMNRKNVILSNGGTSITQDFLLWRKSLCLFWEFPPHL